MSALNERIQQFRKMAGDDPENELAHFSLGKALLEAEEFADAAVSLKRTIEINPKISKAFQFLGQALIKSDKTEEAIKVLTEGFAVADERGENMPRDEMAKLIKEQGGTPPVPKGKQATKSGGTGTHSCLRCGTSTGQKLAAAPMSDEVGKLIHEKICSDCWKEWLEQGIKVINELRLDLSDEKGQNTYDQYMKEFLSLPTEGV